jgi:hypothetical protein
MTLNEQSTLYDTARLLRRMLYSSHHLNHFDKASFATLPRQHGLTCGAECAMVLQEGVAACRSDLEACKAACGGSPSSAFLVD